MECITRIGLGLIIISVLSGCRPANATQAPAAASPTPVETAADLSANALATLNSLEKVDEHPLYLMYYVGSYANLAAMDFSGNHSFACSLFAALGDEEHLLYGRNFDWSNIPALLLFTNPPDGYASVSMVDLSYFDLGMEPFGDLFEIPIPEREPLLWTPFLPIDGINEQGLTIGMAAVSESLASHDPSLPTIGSLGIIREILDHARTTDEAVVLFSRYNIDFSGGPAIHYLIADSRGQAIVVEYIDGKMVVLPNEHAWHLATNHLLGNGEQGDGGSAWRYDLLEKRLAISGGVLSPAEAMDLLSDVSQRLAPTQWSVVYDASTGSISLVMARNYETVHTYQLEMFDP